MPETWDPSVPPGYQLAVHRWGQPVGVEEARTKHWGELVAAAEEGTVTLITLDRSGPHWVALAPLSEVTESLEKLPVWPLSEARARLGDLVRAATANYCEPEPQLLSRHRRPIAALIAVQALDRRPEAGECLNVEALLEEGCTITLEFFPGESGTVDQHGDVVDPPVPSAYVAIARDAEGADIGSGDGGSVAEALRCITKSRHWADDVPEGGYSDEPPF